MTQQIPVFKFRSPHGEDIAFEIDLIQNKPVLTQSQKPRRDAFYVIFLVTAGSGPYYIDFERYDIRPNAVYFITPGQVHYWHLQDGIAGYALLFREEFVLARRDEHDFLRNLDYFHNVGGTFALYLDDEEFAPLLELADTLMREFLNNQYGRVPTLQALLEVFLIQAQRQYTRAHNVQEAHTLTAPVRLTRDFVNLVDQHFLTTHLVRDYAAMLAVTPEHLTEMSRQVTGKSAGQVIRSRVALEARRLLVHTDLAVSQISESLNFEDQSYFTRFFKREIGQTPTAYRDEFREKYQTASA